MKALVVQEGKRVTVQDHPVPLLGPDDILVKTIAVAQNPTDWKFIESRATPGTILGCDFSGYVVQVGQNISFPPVGAHVAGFVQGGTFTDSGAYAEYVRTRADLVWAVPDGTLSHEQAATMGCAFWTAAQALYHSSRLGLAEPPLITNGEDWVLIYGGSSSVGQFAIQLAHLSGYKVVSTASPRNFALVRGLGADAVFDYRDPEVVQKVKDAAGDSIRAALDTISTKESQAISARTIAPAGGKLVLLLPPEPEAKVREDVEIVRELIYTALGREFNFGPVHFLISTEDNAHMVTFLKKVSDLVSSGKIKANPVKLWRAG
ncbi:Protein TOXD [Grifola frondosa]|uniref:Protein TOXD n=1 Tax=Grifola frondosa TaxID=5627 RepID=A0A1C7MAN7_GRIFR|nr:Protein TOXD [Grifola frondosa]